MEKRTQEAEEFFQEQEEESTSAALIKSDDSDDDDWTDKNASKEAKPPVEQEEEMPKITDTQMDDCRDIEMPEYTPAKSPIQPDASETVAECVEVTDTIDNGMEIDKESSNIEEPLDEGTLKPTQAPDIIEFHTERTELDDELDAMIENDLLPKPSTSNGFVPKLKGESGLVIDLEANDFEAKPISQDGVDELFSRFLKNACVKKNVSAEMQNVRYERQHSFSCQIKAYLSN